MTDIGWSTQRLIVLRRVTRAVADLLHAQLKEYLATLSPLFRPTLVLGEYVQGGTKEMSATAIKAFQELQSVYATAAGVKPFSISKELKPPLDIMRSPFELTKMPYAYNLKTGENTKTVMVTPPLKWMLAYADFSLARLQQLLADPNRTDADASRFILHYSVLRVMTARQTGATQMLAALHFDLSPLRLPEYGELPLTGITSSVPTIRPPDEVILESVEISGQDAFEEIVDVEAVANIQDPFKEQLIKLIRSYGA
jgi:hypothetical protein